MRILLVLVLALFASFSVSAQEMDSDTVEAPAVPDIEIAESSYRNTAVLQGLNKVTARISFVDAHVGISAHFGNLEIIVKRCWQAPPTESPENAALMEILDRKPGDVPQVVFNGWMFSSSPSLSGLEHPVYDIIVLSCEDKKVQEIEVIQPADAAPGQGE